jgi:hypothetical protein
LQLRSTVSGRIRFPLGFDGLVDEYVAEAIAETGTAMVDHSIDLRPLGADPVEPLPRRRAARASSEILYRPTSIQALLDETLASFAEEDAETDIDIVACPVIRGI